MKTRVLDSWAILEWMSGRKPADTYVAALLEEGEGGKARLLMSAINVGEIYYFLRKDNRPALADSWRESSGTLPVMIEVPTIDDIWHAASLGDPEFRSVAPFNPPRTSRSAAAPSRCRTPP